MPNYNLPQAPKDLNQPIPNSPFYAEESGKPYLEGPYSPILVGPGLEVCGDYIYSPAGETPIPIGYLSGRGALVSALGPAIPATIPLGNAGQFLTVDTNEPTGIKWVDAPTQDGCVSCSDYCARGVILAASAPSTPTALPVGPNGSVLSVNSETLTGLEWIPTPYPNFTQKGQIAASCAEGCALTVTGSDGDILLFSSTCSTGWYAGQGCAFFIPQAGFERGTLVVGCGQNVSDKLPVGPDGYVITADSSCALGLKWENYSQGAKQTNGQTITIPGSASDSVLGLLSATSFPAGAQVFVSVSGSWTGCGEMNYGSFHLQQGDSCSYAMCFSNESTGLIPANYDSIFPFSLSYTIPSWDSSFGKNLFLVTCKFENKTLVIQAQTSAFCVR